MSTFCGMDVLEVDGEKHDGKILINISEISCVLQDMDCCRIFMMDGTVILADVNFDDITETMGMVG